MFSNISGLQGGTSGEYSVSNDTVYIEDEWVNSVLINPRIAFLPSYVIHDSAKVPGPWPSSLTKVYPYNRDVITPAGTFDSVFVYEYDQELGLRNLTYFRPGIGVISTEVYSYSVLMNRSVLVAYVLVP